MFLLMIVLASAGVALLILAPLIASLLRRKGHDPVGLIRILQVIGVVLILAALFVRPYHPGTRAIPPPPDAPAPR